MTQGGDLGWPATQLTWGFSPGAAPPRLRACVPPRTLSAALCSRGWLSQSSAVSRRQALLGPPQTRVPSRQVAGCSGPGRSPQARSRLGFPQGPPRGPARSTSSSSRATCSRYRQNAVVVFGMSAPPPPGPGRCRHPALPGCPSSPSSHGAWQSWAVTWGGHPSGQLSPWGPNVTREPCTRQTKPNEATQGLQGKRTREKGVAL